VTHLDRANALVCVLYRFALCFDEVGYGRWQHSVQCFRIGVERRVLASLRFDRNRMIVVARRKASQQHPPTVECPGVGATVWLSTKAVKMGLELFGKLHALRRQVGKQRLQ
jgi:hypothetical protein